MEKPAGTVRRYEVNINRSGNATVVLASDYDALHAQAGALAKELQNIANANTRDWDDPTDFKAWSQSRARHAVEQAQALLDAQGRTT